MIIVVTNETALCCSRKACLGVRRPGFESAQTHQSPLQASVSSPVKWGEGRTEAGFCSDVCESRHLAVSGVPCRMPLRALSAAPSPLAILRGWGEGGFGPEDTQRQALKQGREALGRGKPVRAGGPCRASQEHSPWHSVPSSYLRQGPVWAPCPSAC